MKLTVLGSNSKGNCYILENDTEALILEAGVKLSEVKKALKWQLIKVVGCVVTHSHSDHAGYADEYRKAGITIVTSQTTLEEKGLSGKIFTQAIPDSEKIQLGGFTIVSFPVIHDVVCRGYMIDHKEMGRLVFITDTMCCEYKFKSVNHFLIEANYAMDIVDKNILSGKMPKAMKKRLIDSHMDLEVTKGILRDNDLSKVREIILVHLSDGNSDEKRFVSEIEALTGKCVYAANKGLEIELSKNIY